MAVNPSPDPAGCLAPEWRCNENSSPLILSAPSLDYGFTRVRSSVSAYLVTIMNPVSLSGCQVQFWVELKACKGPCCSQVHIVSLQ